MLKHLCITVLVGLLAVSAVASDIPDPLQVYPLPKHRFEAMNQAELALRAMQFPQAEEHLQRGSKEQRGFDRKARPLVARLEAVEAVFGGLATRDQLSRELSAHPLCVEITVIGGDKRTGVPVAAPGATAFADTDRPVKYLQRKLEQDGRAFLLTDNGAVETFIDGKIENIAATNSQSIREAKGAEFATRWARMQEGDLLDDPINWYEAAKFCYRWSLDDWVVPLIEEALKRKEDLVMAVQEDLATETLANVVEAIDKKNVDSAGRWLGYMRKHFPKTNATQQAAALYSNDKAAMDAALAQARQERRDRKEALKKQAKKDDVNGQPEVATVTATSEEPATTSGGDDSNAAAVLKEAYAKLAKAQNMPVTKKRDLAYKEAENLFKRAKEMYTALGNSEILIKINVGIYSCKKMRRF